MELNILNHHVRKSIFKKLLHSSSLSFTELQKDITHSSHFNYHLNKLLKSGVIRKSGGRYSLARLGKDLAIYLDFNDLSMHKQPFIIIGVIIKDDDKILLSRIDREPFNGLWATSVVGRLFFGEGLKESAYRQTIERTGLIPKDLKLKVVLSMKTYNDKDLFSHHLFYVYKCNEFTGNLKVKSPDRFNKWFNVSKLKNLNIFADIPIHLKYLDKRGTKFLEIERSFNGKNFEYARIT